MSHSKFDPKDFFLWLMAMVALYVSVVSFLTLLFQYINVVFPDDLNSYSYYDPYSGPIRVAIASLFVFFPVYLGLTRVLNQGIRKMHEKSELGIRKWLIYLALFVSGLSIIIDLVVLVYTFLEGEITIRFILKVLSVIVVFGAVFGYYICDMRGRWTKEPRKAIIIGWVAAIVVFATVFGGFFIVGSPQSARELRLDQDRVYDLENIQREVLEYWRTYETLPAELADLEDELGYFDLPEDPETDTSYEYSIVGDLTFEICAEFSRSSEDLPAYAVRPTSKSFENENWEHDEGRSCFERTIDPERYPPYEKEAAVRPMW
jgi:hypothetical protein